MKLHFVMSRLFYSNLGIHLKIFLNNAAEN